MLTGRFTGSKALMHQLQYYDRFDAMERALTGIPLANVSQASLDRAAAMRLNAETRAAARKSKLGLQLLRYAGGKEPMHNALIIGLAQQAGLQIIAAPLVENIREAWSPSEVANRFGLKAEHIRDIAKQLGDELVKGDDYEIVPAMYSGAGGIAGINEHCRKYFEQGIDQMMSLIEAKLEKRKLRDAKRSARILKSTKAV